MFTGIIEEIGIIQEIIKGEKSSVISIKASKILEETILGDSICVNGVCLTVTKMTKDTFEADVMAETLRKSNIGKLSIGSKVNLERALKLEGRFGGHIVSGHIDGVGEIISLIKEDNATWVTVKTSKDIWSNCIFPFVAIFLSVTMTFIFSIVSSINTYNNAINSIYDLEYMQQYGETYKSILNAFDQNLTSAMRFYA